VKASGISLLKYNTSKILLVRSIFTIHFLVIEYFAKRNFCSDNHVKMIINFKQEIFWQPKSVCVVSKIFRFAQSISIELLFAQSDDPSEPSSSLILIRLFRLT